MVQLGQHENGQTAKLSESEPDSSLNSFPLLVFSLPNLFFTEMGDLLWKYFEL